MAGEAGEVHLVDDGRGKTPTQRRVALPIVGGGVDHHALHRVRIALPVLARLPAGIRLRHDDGAPVRIEQNLARIETQPLPGIERAESAIRIDLSCTDAGHENVPVVVGTVGARIEVDDAHRLQRCGIIEQQQLDPGGLAREHAEVDTAGEDRGAQRKLWSVCDGAAAAAASAIATC